MECVMKKSILSLMAGVAISTMSPAFAMENHEPDKRSRCISAHSSLKWQDRPSGIKDWIEHTFNGLVNLSTEHWNFNGNAYYNHVGVDEDKLFKYLITSNPN